MMIEEGIRWLCRRAPDRSLDPLEADIWARLAARERARRRSARLAALQAVLLGSVFSISALAGHYYSLRSHPTHELNVFSTETPLSASTLLGGGAP